MCVRTYLNGSQFVVLSRVIVHYHNKVVANVTLFIAATLVTLPVWHQCGDVKYSCTETVLGIISTLLVRKKYSITNIIKATLPCLTHAHPA